MTTHNQKTIRVFTAFDLPPAMNEDLCQVAQRIAGKEKGIKVTHPRNIHVTLHFFAELGQDRVDALLATCETVLHNVRSFTVRVSGVGAFPETKAPRTIWAGIDVGKAEITTIKQDLDRALAPQGFGLEQRKYIPHLTIARVKYCYDQKTVQQRIEAEKTLCLNETKISELHILQSTLTQDGPVYEIIRSFTLI